MLSLHWKQKGEKHHPNTPSPDLAALVFFLWDLRGLIYGTAMQIEGYLVREFQQHVHLPYFPAHKTHFFFPKNVT
jgi:hypothetical protein